LIVFDNVESSSRYCSRSSGRRRRLRIDVFEVRIGTAADGPYARGRFIFPPIVIVVECLLAI